MASPILQSKAILIAVVLVGGLFGPLALEAAADDCHSAAAPEAEGQPRTNPTANPCCCDSPVPTRAMVSCPCHLGQAPDVPDETPATLQYRPELRVSLPLDAAVALHGLLPEKLHAAPRTAQPIPAPSSYVTNCAFLR